MLFLVEAIKLKPGEIDACDNSLNLAVLDDRKVAEPALIHGPQCIYGAALGPNCLGRAGHGIRQLARRALALGERIYSIPTSKYPFQTQVTVDDES
jgi:hypothetical protein